MVLAEETGVSKESTSGDGGFYDWWSDMSQLQTGDPALVRRQRGHRYSLTTQVWTSAFGFIHTVFFFLMYHAQMISYLPFSRATWDKWTCCCPCTLYSCPQVGVMHLCQICQVSRGRHEYEDIFWALLITLILTWFQETPHCWLP